MKVKLIIDDEDVTDRRIADATARTRIEMRNHQEERENYQKLEELHNKVYGLEAQVRDHEIRTEAAEVQKVAEGPVRPESLFPPEVVTALRVLITEAIAEAVTEMKDRFGLIPVPQASPPSSDAPVNENDEEPAAG